jgi:hypothetical protein
MREIRHLTELGAELTERPASIVAIEIDRQNFAAVLAQLRIIHQKFSHARCVAMMDRSLTPVINEACDAALETGAVAAATSPRRLDAILAVGRRHPATAEAPTDECTTWSIQLWASLPWQAE